jgi:hypothetical protein
MVPLIAKKGRTLTAKGDMQVLGLPSPPPFTMGDSVVGREIECRIGVCMFVGG